MPITDTNQGQPQQQFNSGAAQEAPKQRHSSEKGIFSLHESGMIGSPMGRGLSNEVYSKFKTTLNKIFSSITDSNVELVTIDLDNINEPALVFSALIVAMRRKENPNIVAFYPMILEATGHSLAPYTENFNGRLVEVLQVTSDAFDSVMREKCITRVSSYFGTGNVRGLDGCVIPTNFNFDDERGIYSLALNSAWACGNELELLNPDFVDLNLTKIQRDSTLNINVLFAKKQILDPVGLPMRSDVVVEFSSVKNGNTANNVVNSGNKQFVISEVSGFIDLVPVLSPNNNFNLYPGPQQYNQQQQNNQPYAARLIVTNLVSGKAYTPSMILFILSTLAAVRDENNWIQTFRPLPTKDKEINMSDIGALNIDANFFDPQKSGFGTRVDTKGDNFKLEHLGRLVSDLVRSGLMISIDCPESGTQSWYLSIFSAAANGNTGAYNAIYDAAETLTDGNFSQNFQKGMPMFTDIGNRIHNGYYVGKNDRLCDIRDIDHLAFCNIIGDKNPELIRRYANTFLSDSIPLAIRLNERKQLISAITNETAVFTGFSNRITLTAAFFDALVRGVMACRISAKITTPLSSSDINGYHSFADYANLAISNPGQTFLTNGNQVYAGYNQHVPGSYKWG